MDFLCVNGLYQKCNGHSRKLILTKPTTTGGHQQVLETPPCISVQLFSLYQPPFARISHVTLVCHLVATDFFGITPLSESRKFLPDDSSAQPYFVLGHFLLPLITPYLHPIIQPRDTLTSEYTA